MGIFDTPKGYRQLSPSQLAEQAFEESKKNLGSLRYEVDEPEYEVDAGLVKHVIDSMDKEKCMSDGLNEIFKNPIKEEEVPVCLEYFNGHNWVAAGGPFFNENIAWISLGGDNLNYRTVTQSGIVITSKQIKR